MKLVRFGDVGSERLGALVDEATAIDLTTVVGDLGDVLAQGDGLAPITELLDTASDDLPRVDLTGQRLGPPIPRPHQILCVGLNYADHAAESGMPLPDEPIIFNKAPNTLVGPNDDVRLPRKAHKVDWEVELGVVIGKQARYLARVEAAAEAIAGYLVVNDVSEREFQLERGGQWVKGKSCETFNPCGPLLVTPDEIDDPQNLAMRLEVNGESMQVGNTSTMVFGVHYVVWYLSQFMVLEPGDLITTGTPPGVGAGMTPQRWLAEGDIVELEIDGLGRQRQRIVGPS